MSISASSEALIACSMVFLACDGNHKNDLSEFELHPDFEMSLVASEPTVLDPVDFVFDAKGDTYVLEMPGYPLSDEQSRLVRLTDQDGDGILEHRRIYAKELRQATSILPYNAGFLVAAPPELLYLKDTDGDGEADLRQVLMDGFSVGNLQHNFNGLTYGLDNWIYAANGGNDGSPFWAGKPDFSFALQRGDFRLKPGGQLFERTGRSSGGHVITFDEWGRVYMTHNVYHISTMEFHDYYYDDHLLVPADTRHYISDHEENGLGRIYTIGQQVTRVNHPEQSGYFSGGCGITYYGGGAFPHDFQGNVFVADVVVNVIHRDRIGVDGTSVVASRGRPRVEFLASTDRAFRPVNMTVGPDGALYVIDMHRTVIEHPEWIPDELEKDMDLAAGKDKGRIYRITPGSIAGKSLQFPADLSDGELVSTLTSVNQWMRLNAQRLLIERKAHTQVPTLEALAASSDKLGAVHALWTLEGLNVLKPKTVLIALNTGLPDIQIQALRLAESLWRNDNIKAKVIKHLSNGNAGVRRQAALSISTLPKKQLSSISLTDQLMKMIAKEPEDLWTMQAVSLAGKYESMSLLKRLAATPSIPLADAITNMYRMLAAQSARDPDNFDQLLTFLARQGIEFPAFTTVLGGVCDAVENSDQSFSSQLDTKAVVGAIRKIERTADTPGILASLWSLRSTLGLALPADGKQRMTRALQVVGDTSEQTQDRLDEMALLHFAEIEQKKETLFDLLQPDQQMNLQLEAIDQLASLQYPELADELISSWPSIGPSVRRKATDILIYNSQYHTALLDALEAGEVKVAEFNFDLERRRRLLKSKDETVVSRASQLFTDAGVVQRAEAIEQMRPALHMVGSATRGGQIFSIQCGQCHRYENAGVAVGPDLTEISRKSKETLLHDILDPNAAADPEYISHIITTSEGVLTGIIASENDKEITVMTMGGMEKKVLRRDIGDIRSTGLSLMPEGLEGTIDRQQMADLLAFLQQEVM